jgi:hypothetical protein
MNSNAKDSTQKMKTKKLVIAAIARNIGSSFGKDLARIESAFADFKQITWVVVESDSSDDSVELLRKFATERPSFNLVELGKLDNGVTTRTERLALARNCYLDFIEMNQIDLDFLAVVDLNSLNVRINLQGIRSCFVRDDWDVVTANQLGPYYDIWALRHELWSPNDCWLQHDFLRKYVRNPEKALLVAVNSRMLRIPRNSSWIEVDSSFGGLAIYKKDSFTGSRYSGKTEHGIDICEHVTFHAHLRHQGKRIFINPSLINAKFTDHSRRSTLLYSLLRRADYPRKFLSRVVKKVN